MYNPERFRSEDMTEAFALMDRYPFATLISVAEGDPFISHLPLTTKRHGDKFEVVGHMARANPHWKILTASPARIIFHGPHVYITPRWYEKNDVPTWSYMTVHASGCATLIEDGEGIIACLKDLSHQTERHWPSGWEFYLPPDLAGEALSRGIVGFRIMIDKIDFKRKLNQRQSSQGRAGVLKGLATRTDDNSREVLAEMSKLYLANGEWKR